MEVFCSWFQQARDKCENCCGIHSLHVTPEYQSLTNNKQATNNYLYQICSSLKHTKSKRLQLCVWRMDEFVVCEAGLLLIDFGLETEPLKGSYYSGVYTTIILQLFLQFKRNYGIRCQECSISLCFAIDS